MHYKAPDNSLHFLDDDSFVHLLPAGSVPITDEEAEAIRVANTPVITPTPLEQIRALEQQYSDTQAKVTRQALLVLALDKAMTYPEAAGMTREEVHAFLMTQDNGYRALFNLEQEVGKLRSKM
jgi:hypothetical protein